MPSRYRIEVSGFGLVFFLFHLVWGVVQFRSALTRDQRIEAIGAVVPGLAGLSLLASVWIPWRPASLALLIAGLPILVIGRATYELVIISLGGFQDLKEKGGR